ncbi:MAG TPA: DsbA family protein [Sphingobium sp.]|uniref:DsbA family protein n=1 Tax=unclassified Sphingobium TaxID=2611147 RepID=UPI0007F47DE0|nr:MULTISPECIES: DsbA family protein [unclassified Sphingobium]OAN51714.1 disulfide bond formation protein DsbA [Sphingobium sp. TCM1]WIW88551.1 DsbA family protein [Sphingobium sp. V4]HAF42147.1 DsbA family protein [Sphingobium sp.]
MTDQTRPTFRAALSNRTMQMTLGAFAFIAAAAGAALAVQAAPASVNATDKAAIEKIVHDYILEHPEIIPQAVEKLQAKRMSGTIESSRSALETPYAGAWEGAANADVTVVEFFDYACGYCRASLPDLAKLVGSDAKVKVVYRELPILSEESSDAAKVSLLAAERGQYMAYHKALYGAGKVTRDTIVAAAARAGITKSEAESAIASSKYDAEIQSNIALAQKLQATGTPTFVIGGQVLSGAVGYDALREGVAAARGK